MALLSVIEIIIKLFFSVIKIQIMFKKIKDFVTSKFKGTLAWLKPKAETAIHITNALKKAVESPVASYIVDLTPTKLDDAALALARKYLGKAAEEMLVAENIIAAGANYSDIMNTIIDYLRSKSKEARQVVDGTAGEAHRVPG